MSKTAKIYLDAPDIGATEKKFLSKAIDSGYVSTIGPFVPEFEKRFAQYLNVKTAVSTQSGTAALHTALYELGIGPGDEVIVPALTFIATVNPVIYVGAVPVFADVDLDTWNISPDDIEKKITKKTKAIIPVHLYGNSCDMGKIMRIAKKHRLYVVEDATESLGAEYKGRHTGTFGDFGIFSFNGNKVMTTGGGGMIIGKSSVRVKHIKFLVNQARLEKKGYYHPEIGFNYRMTNLEAAIGLAQLEQLKKFLVEKKKMNNIYRKELLDTGFITFQKEYDNADSAYWITCILLEENMDIDALSRKLRAKRIPTRRIFMPVIAFPPYKKRGNTGYANSYRIYDRGLCLPSSTLNTEDDIYRVSHTIKKLIQAG